MYTLCVQRTLPKMGGGGWAVGGSCCICKMAVKCWSKVLPRAAFFILFFSGEKQRCHPSLAGFLPRLASVVTM